MEWAATAAEVRMGRMTDLGFIADLRGVKAAYSYVVVDV